jgi:DNA-binding NtrC family response regulator
LEVLDLQLRGESGLDVLPQLKALRPEMSVIILTAYGTIERAVEAMRRSADNFLVNPIEPPRLLTIVEKGLEAYRLRRKNIQLERLATPSQPMVWNPDGPMGQVLKLVEAVASRDTTVLLRGETGTGKGLLARLIHDASPRRREPFVQLNCAGLQRDLTESELFGHERGAFTGAVERKIGLFEAAHGGTLLLDEIGEMDLAVQAKLLNVLEQKRVRRLGGVAEIEVDVRLIAATHRHLADDVAAGRFREDLFYRLNVFRIDLPSLRERPEDILPLAHHFLSEFCGGQTSGISTDAAEMLRSYSWPGNVRELRNVMERAAIVCPPGSELLPVHLSLLETWSPPATTSRITEGAATSTIEQVEREHLRAALQTHAWNLRATAQALGISRGKLYRLLEKYKISPPNG